jgi:NADH-quinone oxidoreductase subunit M
MLWLVQRLFYGPESEQAASKPAIDLDGRELAVLWPLAVLTLVMGLAPSLWLPQIEQGVNPPQMNGSAFLPEHMLTFHIKQEGQR